MASLKAQLAIAYAGIPEWTAPVRIDGSFLWSGTCLGHRRVLITKTEQALDLDFCAGLSGQQTGPVLALHAQDDDPSGRGPIMLIRSGEQNPSMILPRGHAVLWRPGSVVWKARSSGANGPARVLLLWGFGETSQT